MRHAAHLVVGGNVGQPAKPALAFDLTRGALIKGARMAGVSRFGKQDGDEDTRPLALSHSVVPMPGAAANASTDYDAVVGAIAELRDIGSNAGVSYVNATKDTKATFATKTNVLTTNGAFGIQWFICEKPKDQLLKLDFLTWGGAGSGYIFQIRDGRPEFGGLSAAWNGSDETTLRDLWKLESPTAAEQTQIAKLIAKIYVDFESLSLENSTGKDEWIGALFTISFIPEPRGFVHFVIEGGGVSSHENTKITATKIAGQLWGASKITVGTEGGAMFWQIKKVNRARKGTIDYGPLRKPQGPDPLDGLSAKVMADQSGGTVAYDTVFSDVDYPTPDDGTLEAQLSKLGASWFGLRATLTGDGTATPWLYGLSARTPQGAFVRSDPVIPTLDTANLYLPATEGAPHEAGNPILDINTVTERNGERHGSIILRDVNGLTLAGIGGTGNPGIAALMNRRASCGIDGLSIFIDGIITGGRYTDAARYAYAPPSGGALQQGAPAVAKGETRAELDWFDGWHLLRKFKCTPPLINDDLFLGAAIDAVLRVTGQSLAEGIGTGPRIDGAALGEAWASTNDRNATCADVILGLMDRYGFGLRIAQTRAGNWRLLPISSAVVAAFTSSGSQNDPDGLRGGTRHIVQAPLDWFFDYGDFYNSFTLIWGAPGKEKVYKSRIEESIYQPDYLNYVGYEIEYEETIAPDIRTPAAADLMMRSLKFRYGRGTRFLSCPTYYRPDLAPGDRVTVDGKPCEIDSIGGTSIANDAMSLTFMALPL